jgi:hypothetical protein
MNTVHRGQAQAPPVCISSHRGQAQAPPVCISSHRGQAKVPPVCISSHRGQAQVPPVCISSHRGQAQAPPVCISSHAAKFCRRYYVLRIVVLLGDFLGTGVWRVMEVPHALETDPQTQACESYVVTVLRLSRSYLTLFFYIT